MILSHMENQDYKILEIEAKNNIEREEEER